MNNPHTNIRQAEVKDAEDIYNVRYQAWLDTYPNEGLGITREMIETKFADRVGRIAKVRGYLENQDNNVSIVAEINGQIVGEGVYAIDKNMIWAIYVLPQYQGMGVGRAMVEFILGRLDTTKKIFLAVASYNFRAISFYEKLGFRYSRDIEDTDLDEIGDGIKIPEVEMVRGAG